MNGSTQSTGSAGRIDSEAGRLLAHPNAVNQANIQIDGEVFINKRDQLRIETKNTVQ
jgi:hypothetical protein